MANSPGIGTRARGRIDAESVRRSLAEEPAAFILACNAAYENTVNALARRIAQTNPRPRLIMLSGPSASGKTTTSIKLQLALQRLGVGAVSLSMDDFFKDRSAIPVLPDGSRAFEALEALDTAALSERLGELVEKGRAQLPLFDFLRGVRAEKTRAVELAPGDVAVVEGLHALDPQVTGLFPAQRLFQLYVSVSSDFADENGEVLLGARDIRLIRRAVRDSRFRGHDAESTFSQWDTVCRGEDLYVRPYKRLADAAVNTVFPCEPALFRRQALRLFAAARGGRFAERAQRLTERLRFFPPLAVSLLPADCVLREFLGGSSYYTRSGNRRG